MNILCFADLHDSKKAFKKIERESKKADVIICAGDFTIFSNNIDKVAKRISNLKKDVLMLSGNHESVDSVKALCKKFSNLIDLEKKEYVRDNVLFFGCAGDGFSINDKKFEHDTKKFGESIIKRRKENRDLKYVLVTHAPPYKTKLDILWENHCGNKSVRNFIKHTKPEIAISGHLHENFNRKDFIGKTFVINPGPDGKVLKI